MVKEVEFRGKEDKCKMNGKSKEVMERVLKNEKRNINKNEEVI